MQIAFRRRQRSAATVLALSVLGVLTSLRSPIAVGDVNVPLGGGAGIIVNGTYCTLTSIGHDRAGDVVGLTAATCGGPGAQVVAEGAEPRGPLGAVATTNDDLDYAVIKFNTAKIIPVADFDGFAINGIGADPTFGQAICIQGGATGYGCGSVTVPGLIPATFISTMPSWRAGNEGAPLTIDGQLVGLVRKGGTHYVSLVITRLESTFFSAILDDTNAKGGPGAGFAPVPA